MTQLIEDMIGFFISDAAAQAAGASSPNTLTSLLPMVALFVVFYFLLIRPQQKRQKEHKNMVAGLAKGDEVVTMGGVLGKISAIDDNFITLEISKGVEIRVQRQSVQAMMPKGTV
ncbi:preprotein translocase subunit YajC [Arenicella sp. 4NH20-0111]|uniref:preprotein translocase subunit YajC n=1 Tax=Arenicella sp. 4NH20-0111 TaxID=3127648 RepID=UPI003104EE2F